MDITLTISGEAGRGVKTLGSLAARTLFDRGYFIVQDESYHSRIRGGLDAITLRVSDRERHAMRPQMDVFIPLASSVLPYHAAGNGHEAELGPGTGSVRQCLRHRPARRGQPSRQRTRHGADRRRPRSQRVPVRRAVPHAGDPLDQATAAARNVLPQRLRRKPICRCSSIATLSPSWAYGAPERRLSGYVLANASQAIGAAAIVVLACGSTPAIR